jgi:signal transduction histidine kinase/DNA-directed RNA polymerase subunit N (RpoN/RPB10)
MQAKSIKEKSPEEIKTVLQKSLEELKDARSELAAKNREIEIESSLEKVRSVAMSMKEPADMLSVCKIISLQLQSLGVKEIRNVQTAIFYVSRGTYMNYEYYAKHRKTIITETSYTNHKIHKAFATQMLKGKGEFFITHIKGKKVKDWIAYQKTTNVFIDRFLEKADSLSYYWHSLGPVALGISTYVPLRKDELKLFQRFLNVFELAYTRYLDIEQALVQAKEARIELALERVRARAMAMQHSDELAELVATVFKELTHLDFSLTSCIIWIHDHEHSSNTLWIASAEMNKPAQPFQIKPFHNDFFKSIVPAWKAKDPKWIYALTGSEKKIFEKAFFKEIPNLPDALRKALKVPKQVVFSASFNNFGALEIVETEALTDEKFNILHRFGKVFDSSYTRFNDLKQAEAQARESQIQLALERVRARTMAMQKSDELPETSYLLFQQLKELGETAAQLSIGTIKEEEKFVELSATVHGSPMLQTYKISIDEPYVLKKVVKAFKEKQKSLMIEMRGKKLKDYNDWRNSVLKTKIVFPEKQWIVHVVFFSKGFLSFSSDKQIPGETIQLLERFAGVFDQTYTRFLDLQKAEAQAREAKIEAALEKVRARTMAMHESSELIQTAELLFDQLKQLGAESQGVAFAICDKNSTMVQKWTSIGVFSVPCTFEPGEQRMYEAWKNQVGIYEEVYEGERLRSYYELFMEIPAFREGIQKFIDSGHPIPTWQKNHAITFQNGYLLLITTKPFKETQIFLRFGKVFEQTYTRFLDLQKAEAQARESQIELGLERVRARAMAMQKSGELSELVDTVFKELTKLDFALTWCIINIIDESSMSNTVWAANPDINKAPESYHMLFEDYPFHHAMMKGWKERKTKSVYTLEGDEKRIYDDYLFGETEFKRTPEAAQAASRAMEKYVVSFSFSNFGGLQTVGDAPLSEANLDLLSRFGKVFDLTYTRFNDLKQAEAQAKESRIQLALERVRARTMAMQRSDELMETAVVLFDQLNQLGENIERTIIGVMNEEERVVDVWATRPDGSQMDKMQKFPIDEPVLMQKVYGAWRQQKKSIVIDLRGEELESYFQFLKGRSSRLKRESFGERRVENFAFFSKGFLGVISADPNTPGNIDLYERFADVFDQTYTRFLDLQKAEAQAREARIEAALERVRSRSMGMQKSEELKEVIQVVYDQFVHLNIHIEHTGFIIDYKARDDMHIWLADRHEVPSEVTIPYFDCAHWNSFNEAKEKGMDFFANHLSFEEKNKFYQDLFKLIPGVPEETLEYYFSCPGVAISTVLLENVGLYIENFSGVPYTDEENNTLMRFGKVFQQTYTRFLDLQKAEAQARESQIELALERVRARTMAMQHSEELSETATVLFEQFNALGEVPERIAIGIVNEQKHVFDIWATQHGGTQMKLLLKFPFDEPHVMQKMYAAWKEQKKSITIDLQGNELEEYFQFLKNSGAPVRREIFGDRRIENVATFSKGVLMIITPEPRPAETIQVLERFAGVFDLTYTRFQDLQKAEGQARESQIQLALERVRARTMAMQHSDELKDAAALLFQQAKALGVPAYSCGYNIWESDEKEFTSWMSTQDGSDFNGVSNIPLTEDANFIRYVESKQKDEPFFVLELRGERMQEHYEYLKTIPAFKAYFDYAISMGFDLPETQIHHLANFSHGNLLFITLEPCPEFHDVFKRFAAVFEQTYTRFLDLQKAEAQAREAKIEAALEKVRSRSLAMHKSDELQDVVKSVLERLDELNVELNTAIIIIFTEDSKDAVWWLVNKFNQQFSRILVKYTDHPYFRNLFEVKQNGQELLSKSYSIEEKNELFNYLFEHTDFKKVPNEQKKFILESKIFTISAALTKNIAIQITSYSRNSFSEKDNEILKRFAKVFDQSYTRFLDLQKAEAQTREAQIEAALERVRSKAMAMHKSEDLNPAVATVFEELDKLDLGMLRCGIGILYRDKRTGDVWTTAKSGEGNIVQTSGDESMDIHPLLQGAFGAWSGQRDFSYVLEGEDLINYYQALTKTNFQLPDSASFDTIKKDQKQFYYVTSFESGTLFAFREREFPEEAKTVMKRFAGVFNLTYKRFLDLQKAEAQSREAQIELGLERVRARAMAMQNSEELNALIGRVFTELTKLDLALTRCVIMIYDADTNSARWWMANSEAPETPMNYHLKYHEHPPYLAYLKGWQERSLKWQYELQGTVKKAWDDFLFSETELSLLPGFVKDGMRAPDCVWLSASFNNFSCLTTASLEPLSNEHFDILLRFAKVFDLTYTRFNDLKQAEAQVREAKIEAALERVRAKAMAMHSSKDLSETISVFYRELKSLSVTPRRCGVALMDKEARMAEVTTMNTTEQGDSIEVIGQIKMGGHKILDDVYENWLIQKEYHAILRGNQIKEYYQVLKPQISYPDYPHDVVQYGYYFMFKEGDVYAWTEKELTEDELKIYRRFTSVISLTYKRYKDLQQAEANAREAQIEAALERVRSKTMAMHSSDDVTSATATMFTELERLGVENMRCGIAHFLPDHKMEVWSVSNLADGKVVRGAGLLDTNSIPFWKIFYSTWEKKEDFLYYHMAGKEKEDYFKKISTVQNYLSQSIEDVPDISIQTYYFPEGSVWAFSLKPHSEMEKQVMKRFASVFSLTFRRYQELKKAEAQTREATIEAAMEKVRGKAMAMHNSNDLSVTASMVFTELKKLGIHSIRCGVGLLNKESRKAQLYSATSSAGGDSLSLVGWVMLLGHPVSEKIYDTWLENEDYYPELSGEQLKSYYANLLSGLSLPSVPDWQSGQKQYGTFLPFSVGCLYAWSETPYNDTEIKILKRFATIIDLTFRRYMDLQKSEASAKEAIKQAALDRVRAEIASMRTIADLDRITPLIWNELTILGVPFIRCGVFIMDESQQLIHTFLSTPDGKAIGAFHLPYDTPGNIRLVLNHWQDKKNYIDHWNEEAFIEFADTLMKQGALTSTEQYLSTIPHGGFYLHFLPFLQGMLYVGNTTKLGEDEIKLIQSVADAFSTAYARYEDFNKLEAAKKQVDSTLNELQVTQKQLIQSEKMASLGELTAGIAHEIQNPLNFVNNFSEVSTELLDEMINELSNDNKEDAIAIADDVKQNLEKILHHGKRADGIVKGMLQHSRSSSATKEPTDINKLADEYLRLAYHGLRAKDKSFNATLKTDYDETIGNINIIPQDIGRAVLNLITNAFYAVTEKKKSPHPLKGGIEYEPIVTVTTKRLGSPSGDGGKVEIRVADNGNGIPQKVLDKIFQPFFTTKPTGQGTGLGLSLSYDIIKAHGGEIKVKSKEGDGAEFVVWLPATETI